MRLRRSPTGRREGTFRPISPSVYRPNPQSERCSYPFSDSFGRCVLGSSSGRVKKCHLAHAPPPALEPHYSRHTRTQSDTFWEGTNCGESADGHTAVLMRLRHPLRSKALGGALGHFGFLRQRTDEHDSRREGYELSELW